MKLFQIIFLIAFIVVGIKGQSCGSDPKCQIFYSVEDSFVLVGGTANGGAGPCDNGFGNRTYSWTGATPFTGTYWSFYQWDFTTLLPSTVLTYSEMVIPTTCCIGGQSGCASFNGIQLDIFNVTSFDEDTLMYPPPGSCPAVNIGLLQAQITVASNKITSSLLSLAQSSVSNGVLTPLRFSLKTGTSGQVFACTKQSIAKPYWILKWQ